VREAQLAKIPLIITVGEKEKNEGTLSIRTLDGEVHYGVEREQLIRAALENIDERRLSLDLFAN
jgi:threonyl-tRNA synthetase